MIVPECYGRKNKKKNYWNWQKLTNKKRGNSFEYEYLKSKDKILGQRFYESVGPIWRDSEHPSVRGYPHHHAPIDTFYVDKYGVHFVQNKYSSIKKPEINVDEMLDLILLGMDLEGIATVELVSKQSRKEILIWRLNNRYVK